MTLDALHDPRRNAVTVVRLVLALSVIVWHAVPLGGFTYHLQNLSLLQWFSRESPSSAFDGWYSYPDPTQITTPSVDCPPAP